MLLRRVRFKVPSRAHLGWQGAVLIVFPREGSPGKEIGAGLKGLWT